MERKLSKECSVFFFGTIGKAFGYEIVVRGLSVTCFEMQRRQQ